MPDLPKVRQEYEADTRGYSAPLREAGQQADRFADKNSKAALAARKMGLAAKEAADKAARSMALAGEAAEKLAEGEIEAKEAAEAEARALKDMERAAIAAAEAERAVARAADDAADNMRQAARDAELAGAAQKLAALKAAGAVKEHNAEVLRLRKEMPELEKASEGAFNLMTSTAGKFGRGLDSLGSSLDDLSGLGRAVPGLILTGLELLPAAAAAAGGAITLGLGGAFTAVGILAAAKNKQIRDEYSTLGKEVFGHLQADAQPFVSVLEHIGMYAEDEFRSWSPLIKKEFADSAPYVDEFAHEAIKSLDELKPAASSIMKGFRVQLQGLGPQLAPAMHNIATGIQAIGDAAAKNPQALGEMAHDLSLVVRAGGDVIGFFTRWEGQINLATEMANAFALGPLGDIALGLYKLKNIAGGGGGGLFGEVNKQLGDMATKAGVSLMQTGMATEHLSTTMQMAALSAEKMGAAFQAASGKFIADREGLASYRQAIEAMTQSLKQNGQAHGFATAKGAANEQALDGVAAAAQNAAQKMKDDGRSTRDVAQFMEQARSRIIAMAEKMGYSSQKASELADRLLGVRSAANAIPPSKKITIFDNAAAAKRRVDAVRAALNALHNKTITITTYYQQVEAAHHAAQADRADQLHGSAKGGLIHRAAGGPVGWFPGGGRVIGPGTGTSDSIPAMLSNGEFVVRADQTAKWLPVLEEINAGVNGFASGGAVKTPKQLQTAMAGALKKEATYKKEEAHWKSLYGKYHKEYEHHHMARYRKAEQHALEREKHYHKLAAQQAALYAQYKRQYDAIGRPGQAPVSPLPAKVRARPEYQAAMAAQSALDAMRSSMYGGIFRGGPATAGSGGGTTVQHIHNVTVNVAGSVRSDQELAQVMQREFLRYRLSMQLPAGR